MTTYQVAIDCRFLMMPWHVEMSGGDDPAFTFVRDGWLPWRLNTQQFSRAEKTSMESFVSSTLTDAWTMREEFFEVDTPRDALIFLRKYGLWRYKRFDEDSSEFRFTSSWAMDHEADPVQVRFSDLLYQRDYFNQALGTPPDEWREVAAGLDFMAVSYMFGGFASGPDVRLGLTPELTSPGPFSGQIICHEIQDALRATVLLDWMEGREWPTCPVCKKRFKRTSEHPKKCHTACANKLRQRTYRANRKKGK